MHKGSNFFPTTPQPPAPTNTFFFFLNSPHPNGCEVVFALLFGREVSDLFWREHLYLSGYGCAIPNGLSREQPTPVDKRELSLAHGLERFRACQGHR